MNKLIFKKPIFIDIFNIPKYQKTEKKIPIFEPPIFIDILIYITATPYTHARKFLQSAWTENSFAVSMD